jgi:hypothetical protein
MSLSQPLEDLQYSFNSLYTPSYSIAGLMPLASPEEDFAPLSRKSSHDASTESPESESPKSLPEASPTLGKSLSIPQHEVKQESGPHYQKLKMNYFRRLNVVPKSSEANDGTQKPPSSAKKQIDKSFTPSTQSNSKFIPSFAPSPSRSSLPIKIPSSSKSSKSRFKESDEDGKQKTPQIAFSLRKADSLDHFGVFDTDFEL